MSRYHANVTWQSADGTWSSGFFAVDGYPDDPDDEYGVQFSETTFQWASCGHATEGEAHAAWDGANPGSRDVLSYQGDSPEMVAEALRYDVMAADLEQQENERRARIMRENPRSYYESYTYNGASKLTDPRVQRALLARAAERSTAERLAAERYRIGGYGNITHPDERLGDYTSMRQQMLDSNSITAVESAQVDVDRLTALRSGLDDLIERTQNERRSRARSSYGPIKPISESRSIAPTEALRDAAAADLRRAEHDLEKAKNSIKSTPAKTTGGRQGRQPAGVPTGGQFAATRRGSSGVKL